MIISYISKGRKKVWLSEFISIVFVHVCSCVICPMSLSSDGRWGILGQKGSSVLIRQINNSLSGNDNSASGRNTVYHVDNQRLILMTYRVKGVPSYGGGGSLSLNRTSPHQMTHIFLPQRRKRVSRVAEIS